jgi:hypothetical protein
VVETRAGLLTRVTTLKLLGNKLSGSIPAGLADLPGLKKVDLSDNMLTGTYVAGSGFGLRIAPTPTTIRRYSALSLDSPYSYDSVVSRVLEAEVNIIRNMENLARVQNTNVSTTWAAFLERFQRFYAYGLNGGAGRVHQRWRAYQWLTLSYEHWDFCSFAICVGPLFLFDALLQSPAGQRAGKLSFVTFVTL